MGQSLNIQPFRNEKRIQKITLFAKNHIEQESKYNMLKSVNI